MAKARILTERELSVLQWLARFPLSGIEELDAFVVAEPWAADEVVRRLCGTGAVDWVAPDSPELESQRRLYYLTSDGAELLGRATGLTQADLAASFPVARREILARVTRVETTLGLNVFFAGLVEGLRHEEDIDVIDAHSTHWTARSVDADAPRGIDAFGCLRSGSSRAPFFVAWDRAGAPPAHRRLLVASWYRADDVRDGPWGSLPPILVVCPSQREAGQWASALDRSAQRRGRSLLAVYLATAEEVQCGGPFTPCWRRPGGQRSEGLVDRLGWRPPTGEADRVQALAVHSMPVDGEVVQSAPALRPWAAQLVASPERLLKATALERCAALTLTLSGTQKSLLEWIGHHPFLSAEELATLLELREGAVALLFGALVESQLVNSTVRLVAGERTPPHRYFLSSAGLHLLASRDGVPPRRYLREGVLAAGGAKQDRARRLTGLLRHLEHTVGANSFAVALAMEATEQRKRGRDHLLVAWMSAAEGQEWFGRSGRTGHVWPDARLVYRSVGVLYDLFLEWDRGLVRSRDYRGKLQAYGQFLGGLDEQAINRIRVLFVTPNPSAEERIASVSREVAEYSPALAAVVHTTTTDRVKRDGALGRVWSTLGQQGRGSWQ